MARKEEQIEGVAGGEKVEGGEKRQKLISKRVSDHMANERTFLAWIRTGLATITFGFVVERFGLLLRELGLKSVTVPDTSLHYSSLIGVALTFLGTVIMIVALFNFLQTRRVIDKEEYHPHAGFAVVLTVLASLIGVVLAFYLLLTA